MSRRFHYIYILKTAIKPIIHSHHGIKRYARAGSAFGQRRLWIPLIAHTYHVLEDQSQRFLGVDDIMEQYYVSVFQAFQKGSYGEITQKIKMTTGESKISPMENLKGLSWTFSEQLHFFREGRSPKCFSK